MKPLPVIGRLTYWGHSWTDSAVELDGPGWLGSSPQGRSMRSDQYLAALLGLSWPAFEHRGSAGMGLVYHYPKVLNEVYPHRNGIAPYRSTSGHHVWLIGQNDVGVLGDAEALGAVNGRSWDMAMRTVLSRLRAGRVYENTEISNGTTPGIAYTGSPLFWTETTSTDVSRGSVQVSVSDANAWLAFVLPKDYPGDYVCLRFRGEKGSSGLGAAFKITGPGGTPDLATGFDTRNTVPSTAPIFGTVNVRVRVQPTGAVQQIEVHKTSAGALAFDCAEIEDRDPGFIGWANIARIREWSGGAGGGAQRTGSIGAPSSKNVAGNPNPLLGAQPGDTWAQQYNNRSMAVLREYGRPCFPVDIYQVIDGRRYMDQWGDVGHPNAVGQRLIALQFAEAIAAQNFSDEDLAVPFSGRDAALALAGRE